MIAEKALAEQDATDVEKAARAKTIEEKQKEVDDLKASFDKINLEARKKEEAAPKAERPKFERPSERRRRLEEEAAGGGTPTRAVTKRRGAAEARSRGDAAAAEASSRGDAAVRRSGRTPTPRSVTF